MIRMENKQDRIEIFEDTMKIVNDNVVSTSSITTKHTFDDIEFEREYPTGNIIVDNIDTVSAIVEYSEYGKVCALNMASYKKPGGGVANGALAQEECLYRCSNLFETTDKSFYPLKDNECLYTQDAVFFKNKKYSRIIPVTCDIVTMPAINLNKNSHYDDIKKEWVDGIVGKEDNYEELTKNKIRLMLSLAIKNGADSIILGAWGCGVFKNEPSDISRMFKEVLDYESFGSMFENIVFAIINDHNSKGDNFSVFTKNLKYD